jgi:hypothetical protein
MKNSFEICEEIFVYVGYRVWSSIVCGEVHVDMALRPVPMKNVVRRTPFENVGGIRKMALEFQTASWPRVLYIVLMGLRIEWASIRCLSGCSGLGWRQKRFEASTLLQSSQFS